MYFKHIKQPLKVFKSSLLELKAHVLTSPITKNTIVTKEQASFLVVGGFDACTGYNIRSKVLKNMKFRKMSNV